LARPDLDAPDLLNCRWADDIGEITLIRTITERFCDLRLAEPGFWENYGVLSGKGRRYPGYS
jgi:hypothetical protein